LAIAEVLALLKDLLVLAVLAAALGAPLLILVAVSRRLGSQVLQLMLRWMARGLPPASQAYLRDWFTSWEHEMRVGLRDLGASPLTVELYLLLRIVSLPFFSRNLRQQAINAALGDARTKLMTLRIEELSLSVRAYNCLRRTGLITVGQVIEKSEEELRAIRNMGPKTYEEVVSRIEEFIGPPILATAED
jgi:hypothetical protein